MTTAAFQTIREQVTTLTDRQRDELAGLLRKPRKDWAKAFRVRKTPRTDELAEARTAKNQFDVEEWQW